MSAEIQAADILSKWYIPAAIYVARIRPAIEDGKVTGGVGIYVANPALHGAFDEPPYFDSVEHPDDVTTVTTLKVTPAHMVGHPWAFPGHKSLRAMEHSIYSNLSRNPRASVIQLNGRSFQLTGYESVAYKKRINCGDIIQVMSKLTSVDEPEVIRADAEILLNGEVAAIMRDACLTASLQLLDRDRILLDQVNEGAGQTAGILTMEDNIPENVVPLFVRIGKVDISSLPKIGDTVLYCVSNLRRMLPMFAADVKIMLEKARGQEEIGNISRLLGIMAAEGAV